MPEKLKCGSWRVQYRLDGRKISKNFKTKLEAEKFHAELRLGLKNGMEQSDTLITFQQFALTWYQDHCLVRNAPTTQREGARVLTQYLIPAFGSKFLTQLGYNELQALEAKLTRTKNLKPKSINLITGLAKAIMADAVRRKKIPKNPFSEHKPLPVPNQEMAFWSIEERNRFLDFCKHREPKLYEATYFAVNTGMRLGEIEGLYRDCLDFNKRLITVKRNWNFKTRMLLEYTKGKRVRFVPMHDELWQFLQSKRLLAPNQRVFDFPIKDMGCYNLRKMCKKAGVRVIRFHDLRHTFASNLAGEGVSLFDIQKMLGHSSITTTQQYSHLVPGNLLSKTNVLMRGVAPSGAPSEIRDTGKGRELFGKIGAPGQT